MHILVMRGSKRFAVNLDDVERRKCQFVAQCLIGQRALQALKG